MKYSENHYPLVIHAGLLTPWPVLLAEHRVLLGSLRGGCVDEFGRQGGGLLTFAALHRRQVLDVAAELVLVHGSIDLVHAEAEGVHEDGLGGTTCPAVALGGRQEGGGGTHALDADAQEAVAHLHGQVHVALVDVVDGGVAPATLRLLALLEATAVEEERSSDHHEGDDDSRPLARHGLCFLLT